MDVSRETMESKMKYYDIAIVGGGAAGLMAAAYLAQNSENKKIILFEKNDRVGKKLITTGNGRCNISNSGNLNNRYHGAKSFAESCFKAFGREETLDFFKEIGIPTVELEDNKLYPMSLQAGSVVDQLRFAAEEKVEICCGCAIDEVFDGDYVLYSSLGEIRAHSVLIACGGRAAANTGSDGNGYKLLEAFGHRLSRTFPAIVQITTDISKIKALTGIKCDAVVTASSGGKKRVERGEILFTEYGLSGPPILQVSRLISMRGKGEISLDLIPDISQKQLTEEIIRRINCFSTRNCGELLSGIFHKRIGQTIVKCSGISLSSPIKSLTAEDASGISYMAKNFCLAATGTKPWNMAQVTAGGIDPFDFDSETMESRLYERLFAAGEILDIDGDCGGFNLQWAWTSGALAAKAMLKK